MSAKQLHLKRHSTILIGVEHSGQAALYSEGGDSLSCMVNSDILFPSQACIFSDSKSIFIHQGWFIIRYLNKRIKG